MTRDDYRRPENWYGSHLELSIELFPSGDDGRIRQAMASLWSYPKLKGPWISKESYGKPPEIAGQPLEALDLLYGSLILTSGKEVGCGSDLIRHDDASDWLGLSIPTGMLDAVYPVIYPLVYRSNPWLTQLEAQLADITNWICERVPFEFALIGEEASGLTSQTKLTGDICERGGCLVSDRLWNKHRPTVTHKTLSSGLRYIPYRE